MNQNVNENNRITVIDRGVVYFICGLILCLAVALWVTEKKDFSENENRYLSKFPQFTWENIKSGEFTSGIETFASDHFPVRDTFLSFMTETERLSGRKEINGVYLASDDSLIEIYKTPKNTAKQTEQFGKLSDNLEQARCMLMLVPTAVEIYSDKLPQNAQYDHLQQEIIDDIYGAVPQSLTTIDVSASLREAAEAEENVVSASATGGAEANDSNVLTNVAGNRLYYRTDHHWTTYGAYVGYQTFCEAAGVEAVPLSEYSAQVVSDAFKGTIYSKLNDPYFGTDSITSFEHPNWKLTVEYEDTREVTDTPYNAEYLSQKDQYSYFLNNIHPMITITNDAVESGALAIVKDSYANSMIPFLLQNYHKIYVFDTRYYKGGPSKFINEHKEISDVLILYNMNTIDNDTGIGGIF